MAKIVHEHREIGLGETHGVINWVVDTLSDLGELTTKNFDQYKIAWVKNDGGGAAAYILSEVDESGDTWEFFSRLHAPYQADWNQNNSNSPEYIQHRPTIPT